MAVGPKKSLRAPAPIRKYPFTGGAEAPTGRQTERRSDASQGPTATNIEAAEAGCAKKTALPVDFVSTLFEIASI
jgi:hypothetical protein